MARKAVVLVPVVAVALVLGAGTIVEAAGSKPSTPPAATPKPKQLVVTGTTVPVVYPGSGARTVSVRVSNPANNTGPVTIQRIAVSGEARKVNGGSYDVVSGCVVKPKEAPGYRDVELAGYDRAAGGPDITLAKNDNRLVPVTVEMLEAGTNQNICKGLTIALSFHVTAAGR